MEALMVPFCPKCFLEIPDFDCFPGTPCKHAYCLQCIRSVRACPIDNTLWDLESMSVNQDLEDTVAIFKSDRTQEALEAVFDLINVNGVVCRHAKDPSHDKASCRFDHPRKSAETQQGNWTCAKCNSENSKDSKKCVLCPALKSAVPDISDQWICPYCNANNNIETHICMQCGITNKDLFVYLKSQGRSMKTCQSCKRLVPFSSEVCMSCNSPMNEAAVQSIGVSWDCLSCGNKCPDLSSWICDKCFKTDGSQKAKLTSEGKAMVMCTNCKKLAPYNSTQCTSCFEQIPHKCRTCGAELQSKECPNCDPVKSTNGKRKRSNSPVPQTEPVSKRENSHSSMPRTSQNAKTAVSTQEKPPAKPKSDHAKVRSEVSETSAPKKKPKFESFVEKQQVSSSFLIENLAQTSEVCRSVPEAALRSDVQDCTVVTFVLSVLLVAIYLVFHG